MPKVTMNEARTYTAEGVVLVPGENEVTDAQLAAMDVPGSGFRYRKNLGVLTVSGGPAEADAKAPTKAEAKALDKARETIDAQAAELAKLRAELAKRDEADAAKTDTEHANDAPPADTGKKG